MGATCSLNTTATNGKRMCTARPARTTTWRVLRCTQGDASDKTARLQRELGVALDGQQRVGMHLEGRQTRHGLSHRSAAATHPLHIRTMAAAPGTHVRHGCMSCLVWRARRSWEEESKEVERVRYVRIRLGDAVREHELDWDEIADSQKPERTDGSYSPPRDRQGGYSGQSKQKR